MTDAAYFSYTAAYYLPRHLTPNPAYPHPYPYLIRGFPDTAALENRQTLLNDYITSQQMHQWPAAAAMAAQRSDLLRGLAPRDQPLQIPYSAAPRGEPNSRPCLYGIHAAFTIRSINTFCCSNQRNGCQLCQQWQQVCQRNEHLGCKMDACPLCVLSSK